MFSLIENMILLVRFKIDMCELLKMIEDLREWFFFKLKLDFCNCRDCFEELVLF